MIKALVFDAYGTLFDVYSVAALGEKFFPGKGAALSVLWRDKQIEYTRLISLSDPSEEGSRYYRPFWELTQLALQYACERLALPITPAQTQQLLDQYAHLQAFPENLGVLQALKAQGLPCAILSNGSPDMLESAVQSAGMTEVLDHVISVAEVHHFKTMPQSYALVQTYFDVAKDEILFVSSNAWDALGATWFGFQTFWVNRQQLPFETLGPRPTHTGPDLTHVLNVLR